jgi:hypothetical protein
MKKLRKESELSFLGVGSGRVDQEVKIYILWVVSGQALPVSRHTSQNAHFCKC